MAEGTALEVVDPNTAVAAVDMDVENDDGGEPIQKRAREEEESQDDGVSKKQKVDEENSVEEQRLEKLEEQEEKEAKEEEKEEKEEEEKEAKEEEEKEAEKEEKKEATGPVNLGHKSFDSSLEMFNYFYNFLHAWPQYLNVNKYEHMMLLELLKKGHAEPDKKIGGGIRAFQVRKHPTFKSRCFFLVREDDSVDDFSFRKCVDHILPLPEEMHLKYDVNKALGGGGGGGGKHHGGKGGRGRGGRGGGRGHGRGGRWRH